MIKIKQLMKKMSAMIINNKWLLCLIGMLAIVLWAKSVFAVDPAKDILGAAKGDISTNFGQSSTVMYGVYIAEIFAGVAAYIKSKNLFALLGLVIVVIFTSVGFSMIGA